MPQHSPSRRTLLALAAPLLRAAGPQEAKPLILRSSSNLLVLDVSVVDSKGVNVAGLRRENFVVLENGKPQELKHFSALDAPVSLGLVIDFSASMKTRLPEVRNAMRALIQSNNPNDEYFITRVSDRASLALPLGLSFTRRPQEIDKTLLAIRAEGRTALFDGLDLSAAHLGKSAYERRALIVVSDGDDTASDLRFADILGRVRRFPVTIFAIGILNPDDANPAKTSVLKQLSNITGGWYFEPDRPGSLESNCERIAKDLRARYTLSYSPALSSRAELRHIKVKLSGVERRLTLRSRTEYWMERNDNA